MSSSRLGYVVPESVEPPLELPVPIPELPVLNVVDIGRIDFVSSPTARPMSKADICTVEPIGATGLRATLAEVARRLTGQERRTAYREWSSGTPDWDEADERWTLSAAELKKLQRLA